MASDQKRDSPFVDVDSLARQIAERDEEIRRLKGLIDLFLSVDIETGLLNRNGLIDAVKRARLWWDRRREPFGVLAVRFPEMLSITEGEGNDLATRIATTLYDTGRAVDDIGRIDARTFILVLREFQRQGAMTVVSRLRVALREAMADPLLTSDLRFGLVVAVEGEAPSPDEYIDMAVAAAEKAAPDLPRFA